MRLRLIILARAILLLTLLLVVVGSGACSEPTGPKTVSNRDIAVKVPAMKQAVADHDLGVAADLVKNLESDDAAVRFYAIDALRRLTGEDLGYHYYDDKEQRQPAVARWRRWVQQRGSTAGELTAR
jgi:hypothetical protein